MTKDEFEEGWEVLVATFDRESKGKPTSPEQVKLRTAKMRAYYSTVAIIDSATWPAVVNRAMGTCRFFPTPSELLQAYNELGQKSRGGPEAEALAAFELVAQSTNHALLHVSPQTFRCWRCRISEDDPADPGCPNCHGRGTVRRKASEGCSCTENRWDRRLLEERLGRAAAEGFVAAGGEGAFANLSESDPFVRKRFSEAYLAALAVERGAGVPLPMLESGSAPRAFPEPTRAPAREDAVGILRLVSDRAQKPLDDLDL